MLIAGGGSGIGRELARRSANAGNAVVVAGRRAVAMAEAIAGDNMAAVTVDVDDPETLVSIAAKVTAEHPKLNVLTNIAGIMRGETFPVRATDPTPKRRQPRTCSGRSALSTRRSII